MHLKYWRIRFPFLAITMLLAATLTGLAQSPRDNPPGKRVQISPQPRIPQNTLKDALSRFGDFGPRTTPEMEGLADFVRKLTQNKDLSKTAQNPDELLKKLKEDPELERQLKEHFKQNPDLERQLKETLGKMPGGLGSPLNNSPDFSTPLQNPPGVPKFSVPPGPPRQKQPDNLPPLNLKDSQQKMSKDPPARSPTTGPGGSVLKMTAPQDLESLSRIQKVKSPSSIAEQPRERAVQAISSMWEQNIGPLDETPAVRKAILEFALTTDNFTDTQGNNFWDTLTKDGQDGSLGELFNGTSLSENWNLPKIDLSLLNIGKLGLGGSSDISSSDRSSWWSRRNSTSSSSGGSSWNFDFSGGSWLPVIILAVILFGGLLYWRLSYFQVSRGSERTTHPLELGAWPIDPRRIATRQDVVIAFEYLSVLICGPTAITWTHATIAEALSNLATKNRGAARLLARLYELARYTPETEPLSTDEISEARELICLYAGLGKGDE